jgi:hypothetical protein
MLAAFASFETTVDGKPRSDLTPADTFVLFLAGHRVMEHDAYAYPTSEYNGQDGTYMAASEFREQLLALGASHAVLLFDTCGAGAFVDSARSELGKLRLNGASNSTYMLLGAGADASAFDSQKLGHGLLTAGLLMGIRQSVSASVLRAGPWLRSAGSDTVLLAGQSGYEQYPIGVDPSQPLKACSRPSSCSACPTSVRRW